MLCYSEMFLFIFTKCLYKDTDLNNKATKNKT